ncbi:AEC family transporter [Roseibium aggregatum]|uniref:AEC family transporter n=1 Tax=Roseibium aggregatum TaxID=187304 RepID=A0A939EE29_9HYPH|nr:AEC family transporter [Roseibium aggregatum]MBN9670120.1 AEC family transporter [Roseibium aggregatum]
MLTTLAALMPVILVIASGYLIARTGLITGDQWRGIEKLAYFVLFPMVLFRTISQADFTSFHALNMGGALLMSIFLMTALLLGARKTIERIWGIPAVRFTSIFQGTLRWNAMIALAIADNVAGKTGLATLAVAMVFVIPVVNILSILVLSHFASGSAPSAQKILKDLFSNPFILSIGLGVLFNLSGLTLPGVVGDTVEIFSRAALPIGIICVGAGLDLSALRRPGPALTMGTFLRPAFMPLLAFGCAMLFGVSGPALVAVVIASSVPCASNSYLLSRQMNGDAKLMAEIITLQTLAATVTTPLALFLLT